MLPLTAQAYDFRTDEREDTFTVATGVGETTANVTLLKAVFDNDTSTISFSSNVSESLAVSTYDTATKTLGVSGLNAETTRELDVSYDVDALGASSAISNLVDRVAWIWLLSVIAFAPAALVAIFLGR